MPGYDAGILQSPNQSAQIQNDISVIAINWFINRCPLVTRVPRVPVASNPFKIIFRKPRVRTTTLAAAIASTGATSATLADASPFMVGDVLELVSGERVEITADPVTSTGVITIKRGVEGTTAATQADASAVRLVGNSRTGAEVDQNGVALIPTAIDQYCQTFQFPVQVGGALQSTSGFIPAPGATTPFDQFKMDALQNLMDDLEYTSYYGIGEAPATGGRAKQKGLRAFLSMAGTLTTSPTNASAYKPTDLIRDLLEKARTGGGQPDVILLSTNFMTGLATWGHAAQRIDAGVNVFGTPISVFEVPMLGGQSLIECPLLKPYTAVALTSSEVRMRAKRNEFWSPRGNRGDAIEGDWIAEMAIEVDNPGHHAWVEGITAFSAT